MSTPIDDTLSEAGRAFIQIAQRISLTEEEKRFVRDAASKLSERAIELVGNDPDVWKLRPMVIAWALVQLIGPDDALE